MRIQADCREQSGGMIDLIRDTGADVEIKALKYGDYIVDSKVTIERKTADDFLISIIDGRLFRQVAALKRFTATPLLIIEGCPFSSEIKIDRAAIAGALVSIGAVWQLPVLHTQPMDETVACLWSISRQHRRHVDVLHQRGGHRPARLINRQLYLLQGLPKIGPTLAKRLLYHFGSVAAVMAADAEKLASVDGIGRTTAENIRRILDSEVSFDRISRFGPPPK